MPAPTKWGIAVMPAPTKREIAVLSASVGRRLGLSARPYGILARFDSAFRTRNPMSPLDFLISPAAAQAAPAAPGGNPMFQFLLMGAVFIGMYFLMIRPQMKRAKEHKDMIGKLGKGDEVITSGGIAGRVEDIGENFITVEIADGLRVKLQKGAITAVLPKGTLKSA